VLELERGLVRRTSPRYPLSQVQAIDVLQPAVARLLGLAELRLRFGSRQGAARLAYLPLAEATELRTRLLRPARSEGDVPAAEPCAGEPDRVLTATPTGRLVVGLLLTPHTLVVFLGLAAFAAYVGIGGIATDAVFLALAAGRRVDHGFRLTVSEAADGLGVSGGLVSKTAETIRPGRVQAVKLREPLLWWPFGWCRVDVVLAGHEREEGEGRRARQVRTLLPVGTRAQAETLLARVLAGRPTSMARPPSRARLKSPLRFRNLAWGRTDECVVGSTGRLGRVTSWVPLEKVQSLRRVEGPVQRRLGLATVHVDATGRRGSGAALRDCDRHEADASLDELVDLCRQARRTASIAAAG
jgi:putative membrane protein